MVPSTTSASAAQYFANYAEPEAALAQALEASYLAALVVPVRGEAASVLSGFRAALERAPGRALVILVVNATESASAFTHAENERLLAHLAAEFPERRTIRHPDSKTRGMLGRADNYDVLWLDCATDGARLPERTGVGSVRKLGGDLAGALWARGQLVCPRVASTDADVTLPEDYFATLVREHPEAQRSAAWLWPFQHRPGGDANIDAATTLYEISLRYYVLGLASARSPYAYQTVGSTLCIDAPAYLSVRGFPKREAGEDFHVLDKLAKVAPLRRVLGTPLGIRARASDRVPFGTGRRSREIAELTALGEQFVLYAPAIFGALGAVLAGLEQFAQTAQVEVLDQVLAERMPQQAQAARQVLAGLDVYAALQAAALQAPTGPVLRRRVHTWFNALRTLRFVHGLRDRGLSSPPWREALIAAPFLSEPFADGFEPSAVCCRLSLAEAALPPQVGPTLL
ncbi:MAG: hypothetical protein ABW061_29315 [Polyangiaceae bacterium]